KPSSKSPFDDLVREVCHVDLSECKELEEFKTGVLLIARNLEATLAALAHFVPEGAQVSRAVKDVKSKAIYLLDLCRSISKSFDDPKQWRDKAGVIIANYEQFRISAGHLYQLAVPRCRFGVLRAAL
ncbi:MAG TPA: hypothetical protein VFB79_11805, partial [Candidatus Angelobacter sp.]|nr:hypothetical protein [Candidatus Angelobacter sp.]